MAPGFKYVSLPLFSRLSVTHLFPLFFFLPSSEPPSIWQLIKLWRLCSYICRIEKRVVYLKDANPWCLSHSLPKWKDGWGNIMGTNVKADVSRNVLHALCWYKSRTYKTRLKGLKTRFSLFSGVCICGSNFLVNLCQMCHMHLSSTQ